MGDDEHQDEIHIPKWVWAVVGALATMVLVLLASFFSWLGITTTHHGKILEINKLQIQNINTNVSKIQQKIDTLPPKELQTLPIRIQVLEADAANREHQVDALERRMDLLERNAPIGARK